MQSAPSIPGPRQSQVWLDFDGTITRRDVLDDLIVKYSADDSWKEIERQWQAAEIGSRECLEFEFNLLRISDEDLDAFLETVELDVGLKSLIALLDEYSIPRAVLSDGVDLFIHAILSHQGMSQIPVYSNAIQRDGMRMQLRCPLASGECESAAAHCKCGSVNRLLQSGRRSIYIGDGRSDLCPARKCDLVFAKGALADGLRREKRSFLNFSTLTDVADVLRRSWQRG